MVISHSWVDTILMKTSMGSVRRSVKNKAPVTVMIEGDFLVRMLRAKVPKARLAKEAWLRGLKAREKKQRLARELRDLQEKDPRLGPAALKSRAARIRRLRGL